MTSLSNPQTLLMPPQTPPRATPSSPYSTSLALSHKRHHSASPHPHRARSGPTSGSGSPTKRPRHNQHLRTSKSSSSILHSHTNPSQTRISKPSATTTTSKKADESELLERLGRLRIFDEDEQQERVNWERSRGCGVGDYLYPYQGAEEEMLASVKQRQGGIQQSPPQVGREDQNQNPFASGPDVDMDLALNMVMNDFGRVSFFS